MNTYMIIYLSLLVATLLIYAIRFPAKRSHEVLIGLLLFIWLVTTLTGFAIIKYTSYDSNLFVFHIVTPVEYAIISGLYADAIVSTRVRKFILYSIPIFLLLSVFSALFVQSYDVNNSNVVILESILLVAYSLYFLREVLLLQQVQSLVHYPLFWVSVAILFYFIGNLVIEGMLNYLMRYNMEIAKTTYRIGYIFKYLLFVLFIAAAFCVTRKARANQ